MYIMLKFSERVEALEEEINKKADESEIGKLQAQLKELEEASLVKQTDLEVKVQDALTDRRNAQDEIERRRSNLIIYNQVESASTDIEIRRTEDDKIVKEIFGQLQVQVEAKFITRFGKKIEGRDRPMMVIMISATDNIEVISKIEKLRLKRPNQPPKSAPISTKFNCIYTNADS